MAIVLGLWHDTTENKSQVPHEPFGKEVQVKTNVTAPKAEIKQKCQTSESEVL